MSRGDIERIARFERFLEQNPLTPLRIADLCAAVGVSQRTLHGVCVQHYGLSPVRYASLRRMQRARNALHAADPALATVTAIATHHGFSELGRFAVAYRALFGEPPSATLRRPMTGA